MILKIYINGRSLIPYSGSLQELLLVKVINRALCALKDSLKVEKVNYATF